MRNSKRSAWLAGLLMGLLMAAHANLGAAEELTVDSAIECLADEDPATRKKAEDFLRAQGEAAVPALKKAMEGKDPEIRRLAAALLTIAKRAPIVVQIADIGGKPVANAEFQVWVLKAEDSNRVWANGGQIHINEAKPLFQGGLKTNDKGVLKTEEFNQDRYTLCLTTGDGFPGQSLKMDIEIKDAATPTEWKIRRGAGLKVKIVDENDKPLANAAMLGSDRWGAFSFRELSNTSDRKLAKQVESLPAESKSNAEGIAVAKNLLNVPGSLTVFHPGFARFHKTGIKGEDGQETDLGVVKLTPLKKAKVTVNLVDKDQKPLKGLTVVIVDAENRHTLRGYVDQKQLPKVLEWKYAHSAGPSDDKGVATAQLEPGRYAFAVANGESSNLTWVAVVENGVDLNCGTVVLP